MSPSEAPSPDAPDDRLGRSFLLGSVYLGAGSWATGAFRFAVNLGLARLLGPEPLGFYAFVFAVNEFLNIIGAFSIGLALIQLPRCSERHEDTALAISGVLGLVGLAGALLAAPFLYAYRSPEAALFILILGCARVLALLARVPLARLERTLRYGRVAAINTLSGVIPGVCALLLALLGAGVWALLVQDVLISLSLFALAVALTRFRFRRGFDRDIAAELMAFCRPVFASRALEVVLQRIDRLGVGAFMGDLRLGLYHQARVLGEAGLILTTPFSRLVFNLYARVQEDPERLRRAFGLVNYFLVRLMFAGAVVLIAHPEPAIRLLLGAEWLRAAPILGALGLYAGVTPVLENCKQLLYARGLARKSVILRCAQLLALAVGLAVAVALDRVVLAAIGLTSAALLGLVLGLYYNADVSRGVLREGFAMPGAAVLVTILCLRAPAVSEALRELPDACLVLVAPALYAGLVAALERGELFRRIARLGRMLRPAAPGSGAPV